MSSTIRKPAGTMTFYEKAASMLLAAGAAAPSCQAAIVHMSGLDLTATGDISPAGGDVVSLALGTQFSSSAYGFVRGIGALTLGTGELSGFFRASSVPAGEIGANPAVFGGTQMNFMGGTMVPANNAAISADNLFAFSFTAAEVNEGNPVYGWARMEVSGVSLTDSRLVEWAYEDSGAPISMGAVPEPSGLALLALGASGITAFHRRRKPHGA